MGQCSYEEFVPVLIILTYLSIPGAGSNSVDDVEDDFSLSLRYTSSHPVFEEDLVNVTTSSDNGKRDFERFSPKASITYLFSDHVSTYLSYANTFRFPNRDELTGFFGLTPEIDPEKGENFEMGMKTRHLWELYLCGYRDKARAIRRSRASHNPQTFG